MHSLAAYIATICATVIATYLSQFLSPKIKIRYWLSHSFMYTIPNTNPAAVTPAAIVPPAGGGAAAAPFHFKLLTQSVTIQNFGRESADWVEIVHPQKPDFFQLYPALNYTENTSPSGAHTLRVQSLASKEFFNIQFLSYTHMPQLEVIRSPAGRASLMPWMVVRKLPRWVYMLMWLLLIAGAGFCTYWIIKAGIFVFRSVR
jgi:hypothetical protein